MAGEVHRLSKLASMLRNSAKRAHNEADFSESLAAEVEGLEEDRRKLGRLVWEFQRAADAGELDRDVVARLLVRVGV